jgi:ferredoxin-NADP reductase
MTLTLFITCALLLQVAAFVFVGWRRRQREFAALGHTAEANRFDSDRVPGQARQVAAWEGLREFIVRKRVTEDRNAEICSFYLEPADGGPLPAFRPGQYLSFALDLPRDVGPELRRVHRCYSLSDRPNGRDYRVTIKRASAPAGRTDVPAGLVSNHFHDRIEVGSRILAQAPAGRFHLHDQAALPMVLIGGGIGITPMLSMLHQALHANPDREVWLFYGVRNGSEHIMRQHLLELQSDHPRFNLHVCYSAPSPTDRVGVDYQHAGRIDVALLRATLPLARHQFYVCGPGPMMDALVPGLQAWGVASADLHYETFGPSKPRLPAAAQANGATQSRITFSRSGKTIPWNPGAGSLLAFAEDHGIDVECGCRSGTCGGCRTRLEHGEVTYVDEPAADIEAGHCLPCVAVPKGDITLTA